MKIKIKTLCDDAVIPTRGSEQAAGYDLYACNPEYPEQTIRPHTTLIIGTGIAVEIPEGYFGGVYARSGLASKRGLRPANCVGVVDSDFRGEIKVALHNDTDGPRIISKGDRIAQLIIQPYLSIEFDVVEDLSNTSRGGGGFGHTGG